MIESPTSGFYDAPGGGRLLGRSQLEIRAPQFEMIPPFEGNGYLPPGIHRAAPDEIEARFGTESELRRVQFESLEWLIDLVRRANIQRLIIDGSFVTDRFEPNDIGCILLIAPDHPHGPAALDEIENGLPFLDVHLAEPMDFDVLVEPFFATDRDGTPKGLVEVVL